MAQSTVYEKQIDNLDEHLESIIDRVGLSFILDTLSAVCFEKSEHISSSYQDPILAEQWDNAAHKLLRHAESLNI